MPSDDEDDDDDDDDEEDDDDDNEDEENDADDHNDGDHSKDADEDGNDEHSQDDDVEARKAARAARKAALKAEHAKYANKPASQFPTWPFIASKAALDLVHKYTLQAAKRDQDNFGMHIYNDFTGYGFQEVLENQLVAFNKAMRPSEPNAVDLWMHLSGLAHFLPTQDLGPWLHTDDPDRVGETVGLIGNAALTALNALERANLLRPDSPVRDIGLVLALLCDFFGDVSGMLGYVPCVPRNAMMGKEAAWPNVLVQYAKKHGIEIKGVHKIEEFVEEYDDEDEANNWQPEQAADRWGWKRKWRHMTSRYGKLGGDKYDIFKMSRRERMDASLDGMDPLDPNNPENVLDMFEEAEQERD
ncbi:uncharacterized protein EI97DRAFT_432224 [Westerdykella ornata]|uniref:Uncharacterized protein n=1 Tax=Westerdykella ornata TaxID=318751 RepID=A0A6A6JNU2_WESOR|nr:uncharacterized protein EI97DRAFT_432224 [Westerdykella ornata]KAF2277346.1 hypothetical protein EI97DRAFT_432224 [Westerdykella ornata]